MILLAKSISDTGMMTFEQIDQFFKAMSSYMPGRYRSLFMRNAIAAFKGDDFDRRRLWDLYAKALGLQTQSKVSANFVNGQLSIDAEGLNLHNSRFLESLPLVKLRLINAKLNTFDGVLEDLIDLDVSGLKYKAWGLKAPKLKRVVLNNSSFRNLTQLLLFPEIEELHVKNCQVQNTSSLVAHPKLKVIYADNTPNWRAFQRKNKDRFILFLE